MQIDTQNPTQNKWGTFLFGDGKRILDIRYDPVFKAVFTKETAESRTALSRLISALIGRTVTVDTIIANEPAVDDVRQRYLRFDVACKTEKDEPINVEMSFNPDASELVRLEYHTARLFVGQDIHGQDKTYDDLKETYQIVILAERKFFPDKILTHNFVYYDPDNHVSLGGKTRIITVELVKTKPVADKPVGEMTTAELWAVFFECLTDKKKWATILGIINREEGIAMALNTLANITQNEIEYARLCNEIKSQLDWRTGLVHARKEGLDEGFTRGLTQGHDEGRIEGIAEGFTKGHDEGLTEGLTKASYEIARKMKEMGDSVKKIHTITGLSIETISHLN